MTDITAVREDVFHRLDRVRSILLPQDRAPAKQMPARREAATPASRQTRENPTVFAQPIETTD